MPRKSRSKTRSRSRSKTKRVPLIKYKLPVKKYKTPESIYGDVPLKKFTFDKSNTLDQLLQLYPSTTEFILYKCILTIINNDTYNNVLHILNGDGHYAKMMRFMNIYQPTWKYIVIDPATCSKNSKHVKAMEEYCENKVDNVSIVSQEDNKVDYNSIFPSSYPDLFICTAAYSHGDINVVYKAMKKIYGENIKFIFLTINCKIQKLDIKPTCKFDSSWTSVYCWTNLLI